MNQQQETRRGFELNKACNLDFSDRVSVDWALGRVFNTFDLIHTQGRIVALFTDFVE